MRGKTGRAYGNLMSLMTIMKGIPLTYNRDMQEDKISFIDTDGTVRHSLSLMADMLEGITFRPERMRKALASGFLNATELADYLVGKGMPFREAHHVSGRSVALAEEKGCGLEDLSLEELRGLSELIDEDVFVALDYDTAVARRNVPGGTGPLSVARQLENIKAWLGDAD